jgi:DNA-binding SARP family transcriptional activator
MPLERAAAEGNTLFVSPPGYLLTEHLMSLLSEGRRPIMWLRFGPEDHDPATLLLSLIGAAQRLCPGAGMATLEQMRRQPGPLMRWPPLFAHLAHELAEALPMPCAIVLEHCEHLNDTKPTLGLLGCSFLPVLPTGITCILTASHGLPRAALPADLVQQGVGDIRLDAAAAQTLARQTAAELPIACVRRVSALAEGRAAVLDGIFATCAVLGATNVQRAITSASSLDDLLGRIAGACLMTADADGVQALGLMLRLEYSHPLFLHMGPECQKVPSGPWLQPLEDDWLRLRAIWSAPLRAILRSAGVPCRAVLRQAAGHLATQGAIERAVPLYIGLGDAASAAQLIAASSDTLMNLGQWETLNAWLSQLPVATLHDWPWLVYTGGEIAAGQGSAASARRAFATAARLFTARYDHDGACQSLLAESALAAWHGEYDHARCRALAASAIAEAAQLAWYQGWAAWQLGCLMTLTGELDDALAYFDRAALALKPLGDPVANDLLCMAEGLVLRQRELRHQRELHRQAYFAAERAEHETGERLRLLLSTPPDSIDALVSAHGWSHTPLMLKLPAPAPADDARDIAESVSLWSALLSKVGLRRQPVRQGATSIAPAVVDMVPPALDAANGGAWLPGVPLPAPSAITGRMPRTIAVEANPIPAGGSAPASADAPAAASASPEPPHPQPSAATATTSALPTKPVLTVHVLGAFRVILNDRPVENWPSGRGRALFKYLLTHAERPIPRDVLMDLFWPEAGPDAARNSLNVAVYGLRQALRAAAHVPVVVFHDGTYRIRTDLQLWLDVDEFERHIQAGRQLEAAGQIDAATAEYEVATGLYQGDFMDDDPYEEWPVLTRERLRVAYLDTLDRLGQIYFSQGQYAACATLCQLMLARDNCREDAHCRLMRCYSRQGQHHLALRQYQSCVEALRQELDVEPSPATMQLYERVRQRESV